jgi:23S rRNA G2445 N2-methylase RlmL
MNKCKYILDIARDVDIDEDVYILNLPYGWRFDDELIHTRGYDSIREIRRDIKQHVIKCDCDDCNSNIAQGKYYI